MGMGVVGLVLLGMAGPLSGQADPVTVPLSLHGDRLVVPVRSEDGAELTFILGTGSVVTVLSETGARRAGEVDLTLGGLPVDLEGSRTVPDDDLTVAGRVLDGQIGSNTLNAYDMLVDLPGGRLVLKRAGRSVSWPGVALSEPVRLRVYHGVILGLDVELNGRRYPAMLDLAIPRLLVNERVMEEAEVEDDRGRLTLGAASYAEVPVVPSDHPVIGRFSPSGAGFVLVGNPVARDCALSVSYAHQELRTCIR